MSFPLFLHWYKSICPKFNLRSRVRRAIFRQYASDIENWRFLLAKYLLRKPKCSGQYNYEIQTSKGTFFGECAPLFYMKLSIYIYSQIFVYICIYNHKYICMCLCLYIYIVHRNIFMLVTSPILRNWTGLNCGDRKLHQGTALAWPALLTSSEWTWPPKTNNTVFRFWNALDYPLNFQIYFQSNKTSTSWNKVIQGWVGKCEGF